MKLLLTGDVMIGRGIDQVLPHPVPPTLHEPWVRDARAYVELAERASGPVPQGVDPGYPWGDVLDELASRAPDARIINLETGITRSEAYDPEKDIHYRISPENAVTLAAFAPDCCVLANNHVLDWGQEGLLDTLAWLADADIRVAGAGLDDVAARAPAVLGAGASGRVLVFGVGFASSGVPAAWSAAPGRPGVRFLPEASPACAAEVLADVAAFRRDGDRVVVSVHWGGNWGFGIPSEHVAFAHALVDSGLVDVIHGHSSHHPMGIEVYRGRLILYGCGDLLNDYEGIAGHERYRGDLSLLYWLTLDAGSGALRQLEMTPLRIRRLRLERLHGADVAWLADTLTRAGRALGSRVIVTREEGLRVEANGARSRSMP